MAQQTSRELTRLKWTLEVSYKTPTKNTLDEPGCQWCRASIKDTFMCTEVYKHNTCACSPPPPVSSHPPRLAQPSGISKKNRLAMHDAALGSETQPTPAGSESGRDEEKGKERMRVKKKEEGEGGLVLHTSRRAERSLKSAARPHFISQFAGKWLLNTKTRCKHCTAQ